MTVTYPLDIYDRLSRVNPPSTEAVNGYGSEVYRDYVQKQKAEARVILAMPEDRRVAFLCKKKEWQEALSGDWPPEYINHISAEINWFEPHFRLLLLKSLSRENIARVLGCRIANETVYDRLPIKERSEIMQCLSPAQQQAVLNPPTLGQRFFDCIFGRS